MYTWSTAQIRQLALQGAGARSCLRFIRSESVARDVAARALQALTAAGVSENRAREVVRARECARFQGTWMVSISLPGIPRPTPGGRYNYEQQQAVAAKRRALLQLGLSALRSAYTATDLVTTWTGKHPPMAH